jgi:hypothetical protein
MQDSKNKFIFSLVSLVIGIIIGLWLAKPAKEKTEKTIKYITVERTDTLVIDKPVVEYIDRTKNTETIKIDSVYKDFKPSDYSYKFDTINKKFEAHLQGWGGLSKIDIISKHKDSIIEKTIKETITVNKNTLYLSGGYSLAPSYQAGIDYTIKNWIIIGGNVDYNQKTGTLTPAVKIGVKLK